MNNVKPQFVEKLRKEGGDKGVGPERRHLPVERADQVDRLLRALPRLQVDDHLHVQPEALCHKGLNFGDPHSFVVGRERVLDCQIKLA